MNVSILLGNDGFASSVSLDSGGRVSVLSVFVGSDLDDSGVDTASNAVLHFDIKLGDDIGLEGLVLLKILLGRGVDDVSDVEALDGLVLGAESAAVDADNRLNVASVVLVSTVISPLDWHVVQIIRKYIYQYQQLTPFNSYLMLKSERRPKLDPNSNPNALFLAKATCKYKPQPAPNPSPTSIRNLLKPSTPSRNIVSVRSLDPSKRQSKGRDLFTQKQNKAANHNTPKLEEVLDLQMNSEEMDQLSQIKFISKECSTIKQNPIDADFNSENQLLDFSPLFDRQTLKDDFILEIQDISETDLFADNYQFSSHRNKLSHRTYPVSRQTTLESRMNLARKSSIGGDQDKYLPTYIKPVALQEEGKVGKIKKNRLEPKLTLQEAWTLTTDQSEDWIDQEISHLFSILNEKNQLHLHNQNCRSQTLSIEVNYLIGSILNKIKVKGKHYNSYQFTAEFRMIVEDSDKQELKEILSSNRKKHNLKTSNFNMHLDTYSQVSPSFPESKATNLDLNHKISCISEKLSQYLAKNKLYKDQAPKSSIISCSQDPLPQSQIPKGEFKMKSLVVQAGILKAEIKQAKDAVSNDNLKTQCSLRKDYEYVKGNEGQQFSLVFTELNKHLQ